MSVGIRTRNYKKISWQMGNASNRVRMNGRENVFELMFWVCLCTTNLRKERRRVVESDLVDNVKCYYIHKCRFVYVLDLALARREVLSVCWLVYGGCVVAVALI